MKVPLLVAAALLLAGCFGAGDAPDDAQPVDKQDANVSPTMDKPDGRDGGFAAFNETNRTEDGQFGLDHDHDYWQGRERVVLVDQDAGLWLCCHTTKPVARTRILIPGGALVYEGTGSVDVTLSKPERRACGTAYDDQGRICSDRAAPRAPDPTGKPAGVHLFVRDAVSKAFRDVGEVTWDVPMSIPVDDPKQTDMPHAGRSLWEFEVSSPDSRDDTLHFHFHAEAVRAPDVDIPKWPGHPDFYAASPVRMVLQGTGKTKENGVLGAVDPTGYQAGEVVPDKLISYGTRTLHVFVNITDVKNDNPALKASGWLLRWHNASGVTDTVGGPPNHTGDMKEHHWVLPVDDGAMDSPYAEASRWAFGLMGDFEVADPTNTYAYLLGCTGCALYEVSYSITVLATTEELPAEAYDVKPA